MIASDTAKLQLTLPALEQLPEEASYHSDVGRLHLEVKKRDGKINIEAKTDSVGEKVETVKQQRSTTIERKSVVPAKKKNKWYIWWLSGMATCAAGIIVWKLAKKK